MSIINFTCGAAQMETVKSGIWKIIHDYHLGTVFPNSNEEYEDEGRDVYSEQLHELMKEELCQIADSVPLD